MKWLAQSVYQSGTEAKRGGSGAKTIGVGLNVLLGVKKGVAHMLAKNRGSS